MFRWKIMQVATHKPKYVKYLVVLIWKFLSAVDPSSQVKTTRKFLTHKQTTKIPQKNCLKSVSTQKCLLPLSKIPKR